MRERERVRMREKAWKRERERERERVKGRERERESEREREILRKKKIFKEIDQWISKDRLEKGRRDQFPKVDGIGPNEGLAGVGQTKKNPKRGEMGRFDLQPFKKMRPKKKIHQF